VAAQESIVNTGYKRQLREMEEIAAMVCNGTALKALFYTS
jgi:hypothetical protein